MRLPWSAQGVDGVDGLEGFPLVSLVGGGDGVSPVSHAQVPERAWKMTDTTGTLTVLCEWVAAQP